MVYNVWDDSADGIELEDGAVVVGVVTQDPATSEWVQKLMRSKTRFMNVSYWNILTGWIFLTRIF